jgi:hypothetical protein
MLLAKNTSWTRDYILWDLPLIEGNAYCHAIMRLNNVKTQWASESPTKALREAIDAI